MKSIRLEIIITGFWFVADIIWMWQQITLAIILLVPVIILLSVSCYKAKKKIRFIHAVSFLWIGMNVIWMLTDLITDMLVITILKIFATFCGIVGLILMAKQIFNRYVD